MIPYRNCKLFLKLHKNLFKAYENNIILTFLFLASMDCKCMDIIEARIYVRAIYMI